MTRKLYYENPYMSEFRADIIKIDQKDGTFHVLMNQTAFYPEGGGQPCDTGKIGDANVSFTYEVEDKVYHVVDIIPTALENVHCKVDWEKRLDHMQQHLGQHILSAVLLDRYDADTVGFHIGSLNVTIDTNRILSKEELESAEAICNRKVFMNLPVSVSYPSKEKLVSMKIRKLPKVEGNIRIVSIEDTDDNACCGIHPSSTSQIGLIKIIKYEKYKGGMRVEFACGARALRDYAWKNAAVNEIAFSLGFKDTDIVEKIISLTEDLESAKKENRLLKDKLLDYEVRGLSDSAQSIDGVKIVKALFEDRDFSDLKALAAKLVSEPGRVALLGLRNGDNAQIIMGRSSELNNIKLKEIFREAAAILEGKGGGSDVMVQGGGKNVKRLEEVLELAKSRILENI